MLINFATLFDLIYSVFIFIVMPVITKKRTKQSTLKQKNLLCNYVQHIPNYKPQSFFLPQGYFASPCQQQLFHLNGKCKDLVIENAFGRAEWRGSIDLSRLAAPLAQTVSVRDREIEVYIGDRGKPAVGNELNRPCIVTFTSLQPIDASNLLKICNENGTRMVSVCHKSNQFTIQIPHFTRYTFQQAQVPKKQGEERRRLNQPMLLSRRRKFTERKLNQLNSQVSNQLIHEGQQNSNETYAPALQKNGIGFILDGLKEFVVGKESKFIEREVLLPISQIIYNQRALAVQNQNRSQYNFANYEHSIHNTPILQNVLISADGEIVQTGRYQKYQKIIFKQRSAPRNMVQSGFQSFLKSELDLTPQNIQQVVCGQIFRPQTKRVFSLYAILFASELCFDLKLKDHYLPVPMTKYKITNQNRIELIKNWLSWVIKSEYQADINNRFPIKTKIMQALVLRKPQIALDYLIVNQRWHDAQVITNLQDTLFRQLIPKDIKLDKELELVVNQSPSCLEFQDWILNFALSAFYFKKKPLSQHFAAIVTSKKIKNKKSRQFGLQFRLFQLYLFSQDHKVQYELYQPYQPNREELSALWLLSNATTLKNLQQEFWRSLQTHGQVLFTNYCFQLTKRLLKIFQDQFVYSRSLIGRTIGLSQKQMNQLLKLLKDKNSEYFKVDEMIKQGNLIEAFRMCVKTDFSSKQIQQKLYYLACHPAILFNYSSEAKQQACTLLNQHYDKFQDLILLLNFERNPATSVKQLKKIVKIYNGESRFSKVLGKEVKKIIKAKLQMCIGNWIFQGNDSFSKLKQEYDLCIEAREILKDSDLIENFDDMQGL